MRASQQWLNFINKVSFQKIFFQKKNNTEQALQVLQSIREFDQYFYCFYVGKNYCLCEIAREYKTIRMAIIEKKAIKKSKMFNKLQTPTNHK